MNDLKRAFAKLYAVFKPCYKLFLEDERKQRNIKHRTPSLNMQSIGPREQDNVNFDPAMKDLFPCAYCGHLSTITVGRCNAVINADNENARAEASAEGGDGKFDGKCARKGCFCFSNDCHGNPNGKGCWNCKLLANNGAVPVTSVPGYCGFDCDICSHGPDPDQRGCMCQVTFDESQRQKIATAVAKNKMQEAKKVKKEKTPPPEKTAARAFMDFSLER